MIFTSPVAAVVVLLVVFPIVTFCCCHFSAGQALWVSIPPTHFSLITCHLSHVTCHMSLVTCHITAFLLHCIVTALYHPLPMAVWTWAHNSKLETPIRMQFSTPLRSKVVFSCIDIESYKQMVDSLMHFCVINTSILGLSPISKGGKIPEFSHLLLRELEFKWCYSVDWGAL